MYEDWRLLQIKISQKCTRLLKMTKYQCKQKVKPLFLFYYLKMDKNEKLSLLKYSTDDTFEFYYH